MENIISVENISLEYKEKDLFKKFKKREKKGIENISFNVKKGEIFSIIGLNGAGKTTTLKCILELLKPHSGRIEILGREKLDNKVFEKIGYLPEISYYPKSMKLIDLMSYYGELYNIKKKELPLKIDSVLEKLGILYIKNHKLKSFSKGMLQKVGIAQAILNNPKLLFLDEPMSGLDPLARDLVIKIIVDLKNNGTTIFLNTHILEDVEKIANKVAIIDKGKLLEVVDIKEKESNFTLKDYFIEKISNS